MKKIVYIGNNLSGKTKYTPMLVELSKRLTGEGFEVVIASNQMNKFRRIADMAITVIKHRKDTDFVLIDTFGAFNFYFAVLISQIARIFSLKYIPILRGGNLPDRFVNNPFFTKLIFKHSFSNVTPSGYLKTALEKNGYSATVIPNFINIAGYNYEKRASFKPKLLFVRAFHQIYNPTMAVKVLYRVQQQYPDATLCMIGPPKDSSFEETKALALKLGIENSITYTGVLSKKEWHKMAESFDMFINTTTIDNTPVSVMEAMAMGLPVVSTNVGGIPYLLEDCVDAYLVPSSGDEAMSQAIIEIVEQKINVHEVVENARKKVEQFDWKVVGSQWKVLLDSEKLKIQQNWMEKIYQSSPVFIQNIIISIYGIYWKNRRFGGKFQHYLKEFQQRENFTKLQWKNYQTIELRKLLVHAFTTVPYYKELYSKNGFTLKDFEHFEIDQLHTLPFLEKEDLRKYGPTTLLSTKKGRGNFYSSSGSTGTPTSIYISKEFHQKWNAAYEVRVRNWAGLNYKMSRAMIGGRRVLTSATSNPPYYRFNAAESQAYFSAYHISEDTTAYYVKDLLKLKPEYLVGYAMSIYLLATHIKKKKLKVLKLKAVLTSSEKLTPKMRVLIEQVFQCKVFDAYSGVEACGLISENKQGELFFSPDSGIMEVLDDEEKPIDFGEQGEVVATGFLNYDQPLIRYRIGDSVKLAANQQSNSATQMLKIEDIEGRVEDIVIGIQGQKMVRFHGIFLDIPHIIMAQVIQNTHESILVKLVVDEGYQKEHELLMVQRIQSQLGKVTVDFLYVKEIEKTKTGKFKAVISNI